MKYAGLLLLGFWLIAHGVVDIFKLHFAYERIILSGLAVCSGIFLLLSSIKWKTGDIGVLLLSIWLLIGGSMTLFKLSFSHSPETLAIIGSAAGLLLIIRK